MKYIEMPLHEKNGFMNLLDVGDFEYVDPFEKMGEIYINQAVTMRLNVWKIEPTLSESYSESEIIANGQKEGYRDFEEHLLRLGAMQLPETLMKLLNLKKKQRQQEVIKQIALTTDMLMAFIYTACKEHDCSYSMYKGTKLPSGIEWQDMPKMAYLEDDGDVSIWGQTTLTKNQIRAVIKERSTTIAKFLDKGPDWHCFLYTMRGINGNEIGQGPHIHYVSNAWGLSRATVVQDIKSGKYDFRTGNHIPYERYT